MILWDGPGDNTISMNTRLAELAISDTGFIFDPGTGATFNVNATGLVALTALREGVDPSDTSTIAARVRARFPSAPEEVDEHVSDFVRTLRQMGILPAGGGAR
ncbi:MAG TPA: PqqD family protein [Polyangia bacterium]|nr:PqqD family protein [Polyangia bacterium]